MVQIISAESDAQDWQIRELFAELIAAREAGYRVMRLETTSFMDKAIAILSLWRWIFWK
jgi:hypothetical protein